MAFGQYAGWFEEEELTRTSRTKPITREFAAKLLVNALFPEELEQRGAAIRFQDQNEIGWARRPMYRLPPAWGSLQDMRTAPSGLSHP